MASKSGISASYLNEIEKGKKYPKEAKLKDLSIALNTSYETLVSRQIDGRLAPLSNVFSNNLLQELPLEVFGIDFIRLGDWMGHTPSKASAFINAILQIAKSYNLDKEAFYFASLRAYQELNNNYFQDLEDAAQKFREKYFEGFNIESFTPESLKAVLYEKFQYKVLDFPEADSVKLKGVRSFFNKDKKTLFINPELNSRQRLFVFAKELGFIDAKITDRALYPLSISVTSFAHLLNNFHAAYFAGALLIPKDSFLKDMERFISKSAWNTDLFKSIINKYNVSPELFAHRTSGLIPHAFGLKSLYYQRFQRNRNSGAVSITRELHINGAHMPHAKHSYRTYCQRWGGIKSLNTISDSELSSEETVLNVQRSKFHGTNKEYLVVTFSRHLSPTPNIDSCVALGFAMTNAFKERVAFWSDPKLEQIEVNVTCEQCAMENCDERAAKPVFVEMDEKNKTITDAIDKLL